MDLAPSLGAPLARSRVLLWTLSLATVLIAAAWLRSGLVRAAQLDREVVDVPNAAPGPDGGGGVADAERRAEAALEGLDDEAASPPLPPSIASIDLLDLYFRGGVLMIPITGMSFIVVVFGLERWIALRRGRVLPRKFVRGLRELGQQRGPLEPRQLLDLCQRYPSAASNVVRAMLLKLGRPLIEIEQEQREASDREAAKLYRNVRWLNLSASVTPLMGLLGTVQGMILAFFITAHQRPEMNKAESLATGIYVALVTTFGGLVVAIPAAILAHFFEGRIQRVFLDLDEVLLPILPKLERFEGRGREVREALDGDNGNAGTGRVAAGSIGGFAEVDGKIASKSAAKAAPVGESEQ